MPYLIANSSAAVLVMRTTWWIVFVRGLLYVYMCTIDIAILFLMLISEAIIVTEKDEEDSKTISSSWWIWDLLSFSLSQTLNEIQSEKLSIILSLGKNFKSRRVKDKKQSLDLFAMSTKWPLISKYCRLVSKSRAIDLKFGRMLSCKSMRECTR